MCSKSGSHSLVRMDLGFGGEARGFRTLSIFFFTFTFFPSVHYYFTRLWNQNMYTNYINRRANYFRSESLCAFAFNFLKNLQQNDSAVLLFSRKYAWVQVQQAPSTEDQQKSLHTPCLPTRVLQSFMTSASTIRSHLTSKPEHT